MTRKQVGLAALVAALVAGWCGVTFAQTAPPAERTRSAEDPANAGAHAGTTAQDLFERDRAAVKDNLQKALDKADGDIREMDKAAFTATGEQRKRNEAAAKKLRELKDRLDDDMTKLEKATVDDWMKTRVAIQHDLAAMQAESRRVQSMLKAPATGK